MRGYKELLLKQVMFRQIVAEMVLAALCINEAKSNEARQEWKNPAEKRVPLIAVSRVVA